MQIWYNLTNEQYISNIESIQITFKVNLILLTDLKVIEILRACKRYIYNLNNFKYKN